jgi:hypothetical protein
MVFWEEAPARAVKTFFASYYYHANAGAYLNLVMAPAVGLALRVLLRPSPPLARAIWPTCALCIVLAVFANTSRVAQLLGLALLLTLGVRALRRSSRPATSRELATFGAIACVVVVTIVAVAQASRLDQPLERWQQLSAQLPADARWSVDYVAVRAIPDAGLVGFGPGTFRTVFPYFADYLEPQARGGTWRFLHQDYLQTVLEWGWAGSLLWAALFFGAIVAAVTSLRSGRGALWLPRRRMLLPLVVLALAATAVHALVDFPLQIASIQLYVATYVGVCWGSLRWEAER